MPTLTISKDSLPEYRFNEGQALFLKSLVPNIALLGGFGSGKTLPLAFKAVLLSLVMTHAYAREGNRGKLAGMLVSPSYDMFQKVLLPTIRDDVLDLVDLPGSDRTLWDLCDWSPSRRTLTFPWGFKLLFGSADKPISVRGLNLCFAGVDEATLISKFSELYISLISRLRKSPLHPVSGVPLRQLFVVGTPEGLDAVHEKFIVKPSDPTKRRLHDEQFQVIRISARMNPAMTKEALATIMLGTPHELLPAYIDGQHIDFGRGLCYYSFREDQNLRIEARYDPSLDLSLSWDFNVDPMACTIHQVRHGKLLMTIDEIGLRNSNTPEVCREFIRRYGREGHNHQRDIVIHGDAADAIGVSNYDEIVEWLSAHFPGSVTVKVKKANPRHLKRLKAANAKLRNAAGVSSWWIHPKRCPGLIRDLKLQRMKDGKSKDKDQEAGDGTLLGHFSDTADYIIDYKFPYKRVNARELLEGRSRMTRHLKV